MYDEEGCSRVPCAPSWFTRNLIERAVFLAMELACWVHRSSGYNPAGDAEERNRVLRLRSLALEKVLQGRAK